MRPLTDTATIGADETRSVVPGSRYRASSPGHLIVIGGSAGALEPLRQIVSGLRFDLDAAVVVALHHPPDSVTFLPSILARETRLAVSLAKNGDLLRAGHVYVSPPGYHHPVVSGGRIWLKPHRPQLPRGRSADSLFGTAALDFGQRCIGVVLSGANVNGAAGLRAIRAAGGQALVQDPAEAAYSTMPRAALGVGADFCGSAEAIGQQLMERCSVPASNE